MSKWELIDSNPHNGLNKYIADNPDDPDGVLIRYEQSAESIKAIIDRNKAVQTDDWDRKADMWHAAHIPVGIMYEWKVKHGVDAWDPAHRPGVMRLLNDPDYRYLRVRHFII
jgi:hypothetical protein